MWKSPIIGLTLARLFVSPARVQARVLESPDAGAVLSGLGFISSWKCHAGTITVLRKYFPQTTMVGLFLARVLRLRQP